MPKRLVAAVLVDTSLVRRLWARKQERRGQRHLEFHREGGDWFEPTGADQAMVTEVGMVYRARYRNSLSVFFVVRA